LLIGTISIKAHKYGGLIYIFLYFLEQILANTFTNIPIIFVPIIIILIKNFEIENLTESINKLNIENNAVTQRLHIKTRFIATLTHEMRNIVTRYFSEHNL